ncbi:MAG: NAD-dependent epimerase/dehydratase family protein [Caulobacteraceae bacterium]
MGLAAITGATGFLGRRTAEILLARGWRVRALVRPESLARAPAGAEIVVGDLADPAALDALARDAAVVIHCAGLIKARRDSDFFAINEGGTDRVAAAAAGRVVLVSSLAAREPGLSAYAASKRAGEGAARAAAGARLTIVRPPAIYGPGDLETLALFRFAAWSPFLPLPGPDEARLALAHVDDVAAAVADFALGGAGVGPFAIPGAKPEGYGWREVMMTAASTVGRRPHLIRIPAWAVMSAARGSSLASAAAGRPAIFTPGKAREILHGAWSVTADEMAPGAAPARFDLKSGFTDAVAWYRGRGLLPRAWPRGEPRG